MYLASVGCRYGCHWHIMSQVGVSNSTERMCRAKCRTPSCQWSGGDKTAASFASPTSLSGSRPLGTVSLRRGSVVNYMRVLSWGHSRIVVEVPEGDGVGHSLVVEVWTHIHIPQGHIHLPSSLVFLWTGSCRVVYDTCGYVVFRLCLRAFC